MTYLFLDHKTGALVQMLTPSPVHEALLPLLRRTRIPSTSPARNRKATIS